VHECLTATTRSHIHTPCYSPRQVSKACGHRWHGSLHSLLSKPVDRGAAVDGLHRRPHHTMQHMQVRRKKKMSTRLTTCTTMAASCGNCCDNCELIVGHVASRFSPPPNHLTVGRRLASTQQQCIQHNARSHCDTTEHSSGPFICSPVAEHVYHCQHLWRQMVFVMYMQ
jgi:hypothetical protein